MEALGTKGERAEGRLGDHSGHYTRSLVTGSAGLTCEYHRTGRGCSRPNCSCVTTSAQSLAIDMRHLESEINALRHRLGPGAPWRWCRLVRGWAAVVFRTLNL